MRRAARHFPQKLGIYGGLFRGNRILRAKHFEQILFIKSCFEPFDVDTSFIGLFAAKQAHCQTALGRRVAVEFARRVNQSSFASPKVAISVGPSAPVMTAHRAMTRRSISLCFQHRSILGSETPEKHSISVGIVTAGRHWKTP